MANKKPTKGSRKPVRKASPVKKGKVSKRSPKRAPKLKKAERKISPIDTAAEHSKISNIAKVPAKNEDELRRLRKNAYERKYYNKRNNKNIKLNVN